MKVLDKLKVLFSGKDPVQDIEVRVGNSNNIQSNRLCAWHPGPIGMY